MQQFQFPTHRGAEVDIVAGEAVGVNGFDATACAVRSGKHGQHRCSKAGLRFLFPHI
jgi:hypothetical protein